jgi:hypothetical protein
LAEGWIDIIYYFWSIVKEAILEEVLPGPVPVIQEAVKNFVEDVGYSYIIV